jgi:primosomal protein N' (replication factor Y)
MIADVAFDVPVPHPFAYHVPDGWPVACGQRVLAPLRGGARVGMVVALREGGGDGLKPLLALADRGPFLSAGQLQLVEWIAAESLSTVGSTCAALLPPPPPDGTPPSPDGTPPLPCVAAADTPRSSAVTELLVGPGRERRLLERASTTPGTVLVIAPDVEAAARWARRLARLERVVRLDSGVTDAERAAGWAALAGGQARLATGTRSALLAPLARPATVALLDEQEAAHKPPGPPRIHSRDVVLERGAREGLAVVLTAVVPSVEMWWRADRGDAHLEASPSRSAPISIADTRGILRREPLTPPLARAVREALAAGRRVFLAVARLTSSLACDECGAALRCEQCDIPLAYSRAGRSLACRLCGVTAPLVDTCPGCRGRRLTPFGWGTERVEHAVRRRFPGARVARYDPDASRGPRAAAQRTEAEAADVVVGTRGALRLFGPASLGLAGFVSPDQILRLPDFRAAERMFSLLWAAAERVRPDGAVIVQSQNPSHCAFDAFVRGDVPAFYRQELKFRAELGYPPFRRLAVVTLRGPAPDVRRVADAVGAALGASPRLTVYPATTLRRERQARLVIKGHADLAAALGAALRDFRRLRAKSRVIMDVEVDPVEWPS